MIEKRTIIQIMILSCVILAVTLAGCTQSASKEQNTTVSFTDGTGARVELPHPAERIVVTNFDCAEMLVAIGAKDRIVGGTDSVKQRHLMSELLPDLPSVGASSSSLNVEAIIALHPDAVVVYASNKPTGIDQLTAANITVVYLDCYKLKNISSDARALGKLIGNDTKATEYADLVDHYMGIIKDRTANISEDQKPVVYFEQGTDYSSAGIGSGGDDLIKTAGGINILGNSTETYPKVSQEWLVASSPDVIIKSVHNNATKVDLMQYESGIYNRTGMFSVSAVKNNKTYIMSEIGLGPRGIVGLLYTAKILYPDRFSDIDPGKVLDEYAADFVPGINKGYFIYPIPP
jgi:iron complex transport system substrate-binding protein